MKILIINYYYPPVGGAHSYRWQQIVKTWGSQNHEITILTSKAKDFRASLYGEMFIEIGSSVSSQRFHKDANKQTSLKSIIANRILRPLYRKLYWPDGLWYWLPPLLWQLFKMRRYKYDLVISYTPTYCSHIGVLFFKKINAFDFCWIADYGDPFSLSQTMPTNNYFLYSRLNRYAEQKVLLTCDAAVFTSTETLNAYKNAYSCNALKHIPHTIDIDTFYESKSTKTKNNSIRLLYVGGFHKGIREPFHAIDVLKICIEAASKENINIKVDIYGPSNEIDFTNLTTDSINYYGPINRSTAIDHMKSADILINIENINCTMVPSKIVEYLATGLPILNFHEQSISPIYEKLTSTDHIFMVGQSYEPQQLLDFIKNYANHQLDRSRVESMLRGFTVTSVANSYLEIYDLNKNPPCN